jgi:hypothetical protein
MNMMEEPCLLLVADRWFTAERQWACFGVMSGYILNVNYPHPYVVYLIMILSLSAIQLVWSRRPKDAQLLQAMLSVEIQFSKCD